MSNLIIKITGDANDYVSKLNQAEKQTTGFSDAVSSVGKVAAVAFTAIVAESVAAISAFKESERATNSLNQAMANQGIYSEKLAEQYKAQADALRQKTTFDDDAITSSQAIIQGYIGQIQISDELMKATLNLAAAKKIDLASAADLVGKTIGSDTNALARNGIEVDSAASKQQKLAQVIDGLNSKFGGQAEAAAMGLGVLDQLGVIVGNLQENLGQRLAPVVVLFSGKLRDLANDGTTLDSIMGALTQTIKVLTQGGVIVAGVFEAVGKVLGVGLAAAIGSVSELIQGNFSKSFDMAKLGAEESGAAITSSYENTKNRMIEVDEAFLEKKKEVIANEASLDQEAMTEKQKKREEEDEYSNAWFEKKNAELEQRRLTENEAVKLNALQIRETEIASDNKRLQDKAKFGKAYADINAFMHSAVIQGSARAFGELEQMQSSSSATLKSIGKAAAIANIIIKTGESAMNIYAGFSAIPIIGPALGIAGAAAAVAFGVERIGQVQAAAQGGLITGPGTGTSDSIPAMLSNGELVVPAQNFEEVVDSVAAGRSGGGGGMAEIVITLQDNLMDFIEAKLVERQNLGISIQGT